MIRRTFLAPNTSPFLQTTLTAEAHLAEGHNNNNNNTIFYYLCAESTATRPITDIAQCR
jgi:hypothetical protein